jgi:hypothetical protein
MIATRLLILGLVAMLASPALAAVGGPAGFTLGVAAAYDGTDTNGRNNIIDSTPLGACFQSPGTCTTGGWTCYKNSDCAPQGGSGPCVGAVSGCRDIDGVLCRTDGPCKIERVPAGRCSRGTSGTCLWPLGGGTCSADSNQACVTNNDCTSGTSSTCSGGDPNCACQGTDSTATASYETTVCSGVSNPHLGICSDGDDDPLTTDPNGAVFDDRRWAGEGTSLCTQLRVTNTTLTNCGVEAGKDLKGSQWQSENPQVAPVPQREPGGANFDSGVGSEIRTIRGSSLTEFDATALTGVRRSFSRGESFWTDAPFANRLINGASTSVSIVTFYCDMVGVIAGEVFNPGGGTCSIGGGACTWNTDCPLGGICNGVTYCHSAANALDQVTFTYNDPNYVAGSGSGCPPNCGTTFDFDTFEQEEIERVGAVNADIGTQLALDNLGDPRAGPGDTIGQTKLISFTWVGDTDQTCYVEGSPNPDPNGPAGQVGRCSGGTRTCNPDRGTYSNARHPAQIQKHGVCSNSATLCDFDTDCGAGTCQGGCPGGETCERCHTSRNQAGLCTSTQTTCQTTADCTGGTDPCLFTHLNALATPGGDHLNQPGDYYDGGHVPLRLGTTNPSGIARQGLISAAPPGVRVPLFLIGVTGDVNAESKDNTVSGKDSAELGQVSGGAVGIGTATTYTSGQALPWLAGLTVSSATTTVGVAGASPGTPVGLLSRTYEFGSGDDQVIGCIGDSSKTLNVAPQTSGVCNDRLGVGLNPPSLPGSNLPGENTGIDDPSLRRAQIAGCNLTCVGRESGERRDECPIAGVRCDRGAAFGNDQKSPSVCACGGLDATLLDADVAPNPTATLPSFRTLAAGTARDIFVLDTDDTDVAFKVRGTACPWRGHCSVTTSTKCGVDADCTATEQCVNHRIECVAPSFPCPKSLGGDYDGDGVCDDGDGSGTAGDAPCPHLVTSGCDDNCRYEYNPSQRSRLTGINDTSIGNACECGDVDGNGKLTAGDFQLIKTFVGAQLVASAPPVPGKCDVTGDRKCLTGDFTLVKTAVASLSTAGLTQGCFPAIP